MFFSFSRSAGFTFVLSHLHLALLVSNSFRFVSFSFGLSHFLLPSLGPVLPQIIFFQFLPAFLIFYPSPFCFSSLSDLPRNFPFSLDPFLVFFNSIQPVSYHINFSGPASYDTIFIWPFSPYTLLAWHHFHPISFQPFLFPTLLIFFFGPSSYRSIFPWFFVWSQLFQPLSGPSCIMPIVMEPTYACIFV